LIEEEENERKKRETAKVFFLGLTLLAGCATGCSC
jgi:hypothetical protein